MVEHRVAMVELWGQTVGTLVADDETGVCAFQYDSDWVRKGVEISPIHLPLSDRIYEFPDLPAQTFHGLPGVFADSLPDAYGRAVLDAWHLASGRKRRTFTDIDRLLYMDRRAMGALEYVPGLGQTIDPKEELELSHLVGVAQTVLNLRDELEPPGEYWPLDPRDAALHASASAGGARPKAVVGVNENRTEWRNGQTDLPSGFEHYLIKLDGVVEQPQARSTYGAPQDWGRVEYAYYLMACAAGITMPACELVHDGDLAHFLTRRFDRVGNRKVHVQSLCAMDHADYQTPGSYRYERLFALLHALQLDDKQILQQFRRLVFNYCACNHDDHTKNVGFILDNQYQWKLAPAFDVSFSYRPSSRRVQNHQMTILGKRDGFTEADLLSLVPLYAVEAQAIIEQVQDTVAQWPQFAKDAGVTPEFIHRIQAAHKRVASE